MIGLTEKQEILAHHLEELVRTEEWDAFSEAVDALLAQKMEALYTGSRDEFDHHKGVIEGIYLVKNLPHEILQHRLKVTRRASA